MSHNISVCDDLQQNVKITSSGIPVSFKEFFIFTLFLAVFLYSVISFLKIWNMNYRSINHIDFYQDTIELKDEGEEEEEGERAPLKRSGLQLVEQINDNKQCQNVVVKDGFVIIFIYGDTSKIGWFDVIMMLLKSVTDPLTMACYF